LLRLGGYKAELILSSEGSDYGSEDQWFAILNFYNLSFLPPLSSQDFCDIESGSTFPIRFTARDNVTGDFVSDSSVNVSIINITGCVLVSFNATSGVQIDSDEEQYKVDFNTMNYSELNIGDIYTVEVTFGIEGSKKSCISAYFSLVDLTPPSTIENLHPTPSSTHINWTWTNPSDPDFNHTEIYLNNIHQTNTSANFFNATSLTPNTEYTISTRTVDTSDNINTTWVNNTATTLSNENWKNEWIGEDSEGGNAVTTVELQKAIHHWLEDIPVRGHIMSSTDLQEIIAIWLSG